MPRVYLFQYPTSVRLSFSSNLIILTGEYLYGHTQATVDHIRDQPTER